ncbi:MAG: addiction module protein [Nitrospirae bacterium]|nr:addiction module protein [Nitrospirota bacterium]
MSKSVKVVLREAMQLSEEDRAQLVDELLMTLEVEKDNDVDAAWAREVEKRATELSKGTVLPIAWNEVKKTARERAHGAN